MLTIIQNELKKDGCEVDLGYLTTSLWFLGAFQVAIPLLFVIGIFVKKKDKEQNKKEDKEQNKKEEVAKSGFGYSSDYDI